MHRVGEVVCFSHSHDCHDVLVVCFRELSSHARQGPVQVDGNDVPG